MPVETVFEKELDTYVILIGFKLQILIIDHNDTEPDSTIYLKSRIVIDGSHMSTSEFLFEYLS